MLRRLSALLALLALTGCGDPPEPMNGDFTLELVDFAPHEGQLVAYSLRNESGFELASGSGTVSGATLTFTEPGITWSDRAYDLYFFADFNEDGVCSPPPADHVWGLMALSPSSSGDLTVQYDHDLDFFSGCEFLPLSP